MGFPVVPDPDIDSLPQLDAFDFQLGTAFGEGNGAELNTNGETNSQCAVAVVPPTIDRIC